MADPTSAHSGDTWTDANADARIAAFNKANSVALGLRPDFDLKALEDSKELLFPSVEAWALLVCSKFKNNWSSTGFAAAVSY